MENIEFAIRAGVGQCKQGQSTVELESIIALVKLNQKKIARLRCESQGMVN